MSAVAAAIGGAAVLGGSLISAGATSSAANAQSQAAQQSLAEQQREFDINQQNFAPWLDAGKGALSGQLALLGLGGTAGTAAQAATPDYAAYVRANPDLMADVAKHPEFGGDLNAYGQWHYSTYGVNEPWRGPLPMTGGTAGTPGVSGADAQQSAINQLQQSPLYQSLYRNGVDTILNNAAATGGLRGGNLQHSLANFGSDTLAQVIQQQLSNLGGISGNGMSSAGNLGSLNGNSANAMSNALTQQGSARAGGILGQAGIWNNAFNQLGSLGPTIAKGISGGPMLGANGYVTPSMGFVSNVGDTMNANSSIF